MELMIIHTADERNPVLTHLHNLNHSRDPDSYRTQYAIYAKVNSTPTTVYILYVIYELNELCSLNIGPRKQEHPRWPHDLHTIHGSPIFTLTSTLTCT